MRFRSNNQYVNIGFFKTLMVTRLVTKQGYEPEASVRGSQKIVYSVSHLHTKGTEMELTLGLAQMYVVAIA